jgi:long-subunit fatty acid transport protein
MIFTMRLYKYLPVLLAGFLMLFAQQSFAQSKKKKKKKEDEPSAFASRLWYGGGLILGFSGGNNLSVFQFGLAPQVGYKITPSLSVGPRVSFVYTSYKQSGFKATSLFATDAGAFLRFHAYRGFFLQGELSNEWYQDFLPPLYEKDNYTRFNQRLGIGYNFAGGQGAGAGSEISLMYNFAVANDLETFQNPLEYRFNFTWNF